MGKYDDIINLKRPVSKHPKNWYLQTKNDNAK